MEDDELFWTCILGIIMALPIWMLVYWLLTEYGLVVSAWVGI